MITNIIVYIIIVTAMYNPFFKVAANYSRFALQQERKYKIIRPLLPKVRYMNLKSHQSSIEDKGTDFVHNYKQPDLGFFPMWLNTIAIPNNIVQTQEDKQPVGERIKSAQYAGNVEIQDRISVGSLESINAEVMSVFDGHGGAMLSDYCANNILQILDRFISENKNKEQYLENEELLITSALKYAYQTLDNTFYDNVYKEQQNLKNKKIKSIGTCGLTLLIYKQHIYVANCGDSMAIVVTEEEGHLDFISLHQRLSVNNPKERQRLQKEFPDDPDIIVETGKGCYYLKGRLQPTRTLGDYYMKYKQVWKSKNKKQFNGPYVKSQPDIHIERIRKTFKYLVIASDGVWDFLSEWEVIRACQNGNQSESILQETLEKIADMNGKTVKQIKDLDNLFKRDFHDDISIIVSPLSYYH